MTSRHHFSGSQSLHWSSIVPTKNFGAYYSSMDVHEPTFKLQLPLPSTHHDGCCKSFKLRLRSCYNKLTTSCHFSTISLSCKDDENCMKRTSSWHNHRLSNHAHLSQIRIVKWIGAKTMKVWLDLDPSNLQAFVSTSGFFLVLHLHLVLRHTSMHWLT